MDNAKHPAPKAFSALGFLAGASFVIVGIYATATVSLLAIPFTLISLAVTTMFGYSLFSRQQGAVEEEPAEVGEPAPESPDVEQDEGERTPEARLRALDRLKADGLIDEDDYHWKREEIIREL